MTTEQWIISVDLPILPWGGCLGKISVLGASGFDDRPYSVRIGRIYDSKKEAEADFSRAYEEEVQPKLDAQMKAMGMEHVPSLTKEFNALIKQISPLLQIFMGQTGWWITGPMRDGFCNVSLGTDENYVRQIASGEIVPDWIIYKQERK